MMGAASGGGGFLNAFLPLLITSLRQGLGAARHEKSRTEACIASIKSYFLDFLGLIAQPQTGGELIFGGVGSSSLKWESRYTFVLKSWRSNCLELSSYFKYPPAISRIIYTTHTVEIIQAQIRKIMKSKRVLSTDRAKKQLLYLVQSEIKKRWLMPLAHWPETLSPYSIIFNDRLKLDP